MEQDLKRIEEWLKLYAPKIYEYSLNPPASDEDIDVLEELIGFSISDDLRQLYKWHNGLDDEENLGNFFYGLNFYPIEFVLDEYESIDRDEAPVALTRYSAGIDPTNMYNPKWLIIGSDCEACFLIVDFAPAEGGTPGQVIFVDTDENVAILVAKSVPDLIRDFADDLTRDYYYPLEEAAEEGHDFLEVVDEIDLVNWWVSEKWSNCFGEGNSSE